MAAEVVTQLVNQPHHRTGNGAAVLHPDDGACGAAAALAEA